MSSLDADVQQLAPDDWQITLEAAGFALEVSVAIHGAFLRARAAVLPPGLIDPHQLLFWNQQAPLVCFAENRAGEILMSGEIPLRSLDREILDQFLGLLVTSAGRARELAIQAA